MLELKFSNQVLLIFLVFIVFCEKNISSQQDTLKAFSVFNRTYPPNSNVSGIVMFTQFLETQQVAVQGLLVDLTPGEHGFHVHQFGNLFNNCLAAGGHYNPTNATHGGRNDTIRHVGDLGNILANSKGVAVISFIDSVISLYGPNSIINRTLMVHSQTDDLGRGRNNESLINGNSGTRIACSTIISI